MTCRFFLSCLRFSFHNSINTDLLNTEQQWSFQTTERKVIYPDISTVYHLSIIINLCDPPLSSQTCSWIRTLSCLTCTWRHAPSVVLTAGCLQSDACSCVSVPQDCLAGTSCLCVHPDGEASPWGGGGGEGECGYIRAASPSDLQHFTATPYPESSLLTGFTREDKWLRFTQNNWDNVIIIYWLIGRTAIDYHFKLGLIHSSGDKSINWQPFSNMWDFYK